MTTWWPTTWGKLAPGDLVQAPDGSEWTVGASLLDDDGGEWNIRRGPVSVWTPHQMDDPVSAARPALEDRHPALLALAADPEVVLGRLRMAFGDVEPIPLDGNADAARYLRCGQRRCTCRW